MSVECVEKSIESAKSKIEEWKAVGLPGWREDQTRYAIIDPIIRALGWDTADPKPESTDGRREDTGRGVRKLQTRRSGLEFG